MFVEIFHSLRGKSMSGSRETAAVGQMCKDTQKIMIFLCRMDVLSNFVVAQPGRVVSIVESS